MHMMYIVYVWLNLRFIFISPGSSEALKELLQNRHLRTILTGIDSSDTKDIALQAAMQEPIFTEFVDECLDTVDPISRTEKATVS